jgi:prepilin-type processing-associated H-X9-DG protein
MLALLGAMVVPAMARVRGTSSRIACTDNLKQIGVAFNSWRVNHFDQYPMNVPNYRGGPPTGFGGYTLAATATILVSGAAPYMYAAFGVMSNELSTPRLLVCPSDERSAHSNFTMHVTGPVGIQTCQASASGTGVTDTDPAYFNNFKISYFLGLNALSANPQMFLAGDRNIIGDHSGGPINTFPIYNNGYGNNLGTQYWMGTNWTAGSTFPQWTPAKMHQGQGNVLLTDGSVEQLDSSRLRGQLAGTGDFTAVYSSLGPNTLLFP